MVSPRSSSLQRFQGFAQAHRRSIVAAVVAGLAGFGVTAFGIAPLAPDAAQLPQRMVIETITPEDVSAQLEALSEHPLALHRNDITRATDTPESLFRRLGVSDVSAAMFLRTDATARRLLAGRGGKMVQAQTDENGHLVQLVARFPADRAELAKTHFTRMTIARTSGRWLARLETQPLLPLQRLASGTVRGSFYAAMDAASVPETVAQQLTEIFANEVDFHRDVKKGDRFTIVYEALTADGEVVAWDEGAGRVLAATFVNHGKTHQALWFAEAGNGQGGYFTPQGRSLKQGFLASPMEVSRLNSGFAPRIDPFNNNWRKHLGVDYGAPIGTPVRSVGDGTVEFAGWQNGYGQVVEVAHSGDKTTLYAHLSRVDVHKGQKIEQGQRIGAVGMTGWTTGPHLHFEFRVNGLHQDPLTLARSGDTVTLDPAARTRFATAAKTLQAQLDIADTLNGTRGLAE